MIVKDYRPYVIHALAHAPGNRMNSGDLSEAVWGTSGRGNRRLTKALFPHMVWNGLMTTWKERNAVMYAPTAKGIEQLKAYESTHGEIPVIETNV